MFWTNIKRVVRAGFINFWRNGYVSLASLLVMVITLFVIGSVIFTNVMLNASLQQLKDKVDINVYFLTTTDEQTILSIQKSLEALPEVQQVTYISRDQVLANFKNRHENDESSLQALDELQDNPLDATLNIKAKEPSQYVDIANYLNSSAVNLPDGTSPIDKINYNQDRIKTAIDTLSRIIESGQKIGLFLTIAFIAFSIVITFNTIRLAIYSSREEISIMQLVGASAKYVRGPFVIVGIMYGILSSVITMLLFYPMTYYLGRATQGFFGGVNVYGYYLHHFFEIFFILLGAGIIVGAVSSSLAVRRYLRI